MGTSLALGSEAGSSALGGRPVCGRLDGAGLLLGCSELLVHLLGLGDGPLVATVALVLHGDHFASAGFTVHAERRTREVLGGASARVTVGLHIAVLGQEVTALASDFLAELCHFATGRDQLGVTFRRLVSTRLGFDFGCVGLDGTADLAGHLGSGEFLLTTTATHHEGGCSDQGPQDHFGKVHVDLL